MKNIVKRFAIILGISMITILALLLILTNMFEKQIGEKVIDAINEQITTELRVDGFELSILRSFPNIGANLKGVEIDGTNKELLIQMEEISLRASLFSLFKEKMDVKSVVVADGHIYIAYDKNGQSNFDILNETEPASDETSNSVIDLQKAILKNIDINYQDEQVGNAVSLFIGEAEFSGAFASEQFELRSKADLDLAFLKIDGEHLIANQPIRYKMGIHMNTAKGIYKFKNLDLQIGALPLQVNGEIKEEKDGYHIDLELESSGGQLTDLISLLPKDQKILPDDLESRGEFDIQASIMGSYSAKKMPGINVNLHFDNGKISGDRIQASIRNLSFSTEYSNGEKRNNSTSFLKINKLKGDFEGKAFTMDLMIENFDNPVISLTADGQLAVGALLAFMPDERISQGEGMIIIDDLQLKGRFSDMIRTSKVGRVSLSGAIGVDEAALTINGAEIRLNTGRVLLQGNDVSIEQLALKAPGTDLLFNGRAINLLPVIFADSVNSKSAEFVFEATLNARELDIDALIAFGTPAEAAIKEAEEVGKSDSLTQAEIAKRAYYSQFLNGSFTATIDRFNYNKIEGENFEGRLVFDPKKMQITGRTAAMGGNFDLDANVFFSNKTSLEAKFNCHNIQVDAFLEQAENFGQDLLVADNLEGRMDARFFITAVWDENGEFSDKKLHVLGGIGIRDGVLKDFAMLEDFSSFVDIRDLRNIRFTNLENFFEIKNNTLYLPVMFIQSNALNLTVSGQHTFDQDIAYFIKVNAGQVMTNKFKGHNKLLKPKPARRNGFFNLYYAILGNIDNYTFSADKKRVRRDFEESELRKRAIHFALEKALGTVIEFVEEPLDWRDIPEYEEDPDSTAPEFLDMELEGGMK